MNAPLRIVRTDRDGTAVEVSREADSQTAQNLKASLRLYRQGFIDGWVESHTETGVAPFDLEQRLKWDERNQRLAAAAYDAKYGRAWV